MPPQNRQPSHRPPSRSPRPARHERPEKSRSHTPADERWAEMFFIIVIIIALSGWIGGIFSGDLLKKVSAPFFPVESLQDVNTPIGREVSLGEDTDVFSSPGGSVLGTQPRGARGTVSAGPEYYNGNRYWFVDFESGPDGWVREGALRDASGGKFDSGDSPVGTVVQTKNETPVLGSPGGASVGTQPKGAKGVITKGPIYANGERYWYVDFPSGPDGWVGEKYLLNGSGGLFNPGSTPVGRRVSATGSPTGVRDIPGGTRIGSQERGASGTITQGPISINGERFWYVDFDSGPDGWVAERDLALQKKEGLVSKIVWWISSIFRFIAIFLTLFFLSGIIYSVIRTNQIVAMERKKEKMKENPVYVANVSQDYQNRRWDRVVAHVQSENPADWRLAILESDIILSELLEKMGYVGENVGEKLKRIERSDFNTIDDAWEAHKVRNLIAHQGSDYVLSRREAQRVIGLYMNVFREFKYI